MMELDESFNDLAECMVMVRIKKYIRLREKSQYLELANSSKKLKKKAEPCNIYTAHGSGVLLDAPLSDPDEQMRDSADTSSIKEHLRTLWRKIVEDLDELKNNDEVEDFLENFTTILRLHVEHRIELDLQCYAALLYCTEPLCLNSVFNLGLVNAVDSMHINCLYDSLQLFAGLDAQEDMDTKYSFELILSLSILLYKTKCKQQSRSILMNMNQNLAYYINNERYNAKFKEIGMRHFLKAVGLNGIFQPDSLRYFLANDQKNSSPIRSDSDSDSWSPSDTSSESEEERVDRRRQVRAEKNISQRINVNIDSVELSKLFPLSLKNLCRIAVKNSIIGYTPRSVYKLGILPNVLKEFILFKDEIDAILKHCN